MEELRSRRIHRIVEGFLPKSMDPKDRASETDLLLQFCLSLSKVNNFLFLLPWSLSLLNLKKGEKKKGIYSSQYWNPQIYPKHKDLYNWVDVDQRVYVPFNMSYLQESFGYVSKRSNTLLYRGHVGDFWEEKWLGPVCSRVR